MAGIHDEEPDDYPFRDLLERFDSVRREAESIRAQLGRAREPRIWPERRRRSRRFDPLLPTADRPASHGTGSSEQ